MKFIKHLSIIPLVLLSIAFTQNNGLDEIIRSGDEVEKIAGGFQFTEGPSADAKGNVYFTDQPNDRIMVWSTDNKLSTFMQPSGRSNGLAFDKDGNLWACADEKNELWCIGKDKKVTIISSMYNDKVLNGPNDLWIDNNGGVYFTDPFYKRPWWNHTAMPQSCQAVYYLKPDHKTIIRLIDDLVQPNGITGSPDGKSLYIADIGGNRTWRYTVGKDGSLGDKKLFCEMGSDGMAIDSRGNIYLTGTGVTVYNADGILLGNIPVPENWTANVCFGGEDMHTLFITASKSIYKIHTLIKGVY